MTLDLIRGMGKTTGLTTGLALALMGLVAPLSAAPASSDPIQADVSDDFQDGIALLKQGKTQEALKAFQRVLASDPSNEEAYELWKSTDEQLFLEMLVKGGEFELIAKRFLHRASLGRTERRNDSAAIGELVGSLKNASTSAERRAAISALSAEHGEYAVPRLVHVLADSSDQDWRITAMHALTQMDTDVVLPLIEALNTDDAYQRANVAMVLGHVGDGRAAAALMVHAASDEDGKVRRAAETAAASCGASGSAADQFLALGEDYYYRRDNVLRDMDYSDVVWSWEGRGLVSTSMPRPIYHSTLSKRAYLAALALDSGSLDALAGVARASVDISVRLAQLEEAGEDTSAHQAAADAGALIVPTCGSSAVDLALHWSVIADDSAAGVGLARALGTFGNEYTDGLWAALESSDGALRGEAAVALGAISARTGSAADARVVATLGEIVGREVMRLVAVIDGDFGRADSLCGSIGGPGVLVNHRGTGAQGINLIRRVGGFDAIVLGDNLPDMTIDQVLSAASQGGSDTPILLATTNANTADAYADRITDVIGDLSDLSALDAVFETALSGDRARADDLSRRAAAVLGDLARGGRTDIGSALADLAKPLSHRPDEVTLPAMDALASAGSPDQVSTLIAVITNGERSDEARVAAGQALAGIFGRHQVSGETASGLSAVVRSDASLAVRTAAAQALGLTRMAGGVRAGLVGDL